MAGNSRTFTDLDLNFIAHPITHDVTRRYDEQAIKQSLKNLIMTLNYERPFHPEIGSQVMQLLFEPVSPITQHMLEAAIRDTITNFEPRVNVIRTDVRFNNDNQTVYIAITFTIVNTEKPLTVDFTLQRTR
jgi:hypothetical protein